MSSSLQFLHGLFLCVYVPGIIFHRNIGELTFFFNILVFFLTFLLYILVHISIISFYCLSSLNCNLYNFCYVFNLSRITNYRYTLLINTNIQFRRVLFSSNTNRPNEHMNIRVFVSFHFYMFFLKHGTRIYRYYCIC